MFILVSTNLAIIIQLKFTDVELFDSYSLKNGSPVISIRLEFPLVEFTAPSFQIQWEEVRFDNPCSVAK